MRQTKAKGIAFGTGVLILAAVVLFAVLQQADFAVATGGVASEGAAMDSPPTERSVSAPGDVEEAPGGVEEAVEEVGEAGPEASQVPDSVLAVGRRVYEEQNCSVCHSIAGEGSPRSPLDGVGSRLDAAEIRLWIVNPQEARPGVGKPAFDDLPEAEVEALVAYLQSLTDG